MDAAIPAAVLLWATAYDEDRHEDDEERETVAEGAAAVVAAAAAALRSVSSTEDTTSEGFKLAAPAPSPVSPFESASS
jgi:hypothetical protein